MKKIILAAMTTVMVVNAAPSFAWNQHRCNIAVDATRAQQGKLLKECVGKFSKQHYKYLMGEYKRHNGKDIKKMPDRVQKVLRDADKAYKNPKIKWLDEEAQDHIKNAKLAGSVIGIFAGVVVSAAAIATVAASPVATAAIVGGIAVP